MNKIYQIIEKDPNEPMSVDELIQRYIFLEEKMKMKHVKVEKNLDDLTEKLIREKESLQNASEERDLGNGVTESSRLFVTVIEAKDLNSGGLITDCCPFVTLTFQDETEQT